MGLWLLLASTLGIPAMGAAANLALRIRSSGVLTAGADWLLLLWVFDLTAIYAYGEFKHFIPHPELANHVPGLFAILTAVAVAGWIAVVNMLEPKVSVQRSKGLKAFVAPLFWFGLSWTVVVTLTAAHLLVFLWRG